MNEKEKEKEEAFEDIENWTITGVFIKKDLNSLHDSDLDFDLS